MTEPKAESPPTAKRQRRTLRRLGIYLLVFATLALGLHLFNSWRFGLFSLRAALNDKIDHAEELAEAASSFDQGKVLEALAPSSLCGPIYRFDDSVSDATVIAMEGSKKPAAQIEPYEGFEFDGAESGFDSEKAEHELRDGSLRVRYRKDLYFYSTKELSLPWAEIAEVEIRMKLHKGDAVELALGRDPEAKRKGPSGHGGVEWQETLGILNYNVIPDGEFHVYRADATKAESSKRIAEENNLRRIIVRPSNVEGDDVEIDYIRFIASGEKFRDHPYAQIDQILDGEQRRTLYMRTPMTLEYEVDVPRAGAGLRFGMGAFEADVEINFKVQVVEGEAVEEVFSQAVRERLSWLDANVSLEKWEGKRVRIRLVCESEQENVAFWANPILLGAPKKRMNVVFVLEDTLRADHLSAYGYFRETSPELDRWAERAVLFENAVSQGCVTRSSCASLMTSLYPTATGVWNYSDRLDDRYLTLAEILRSQGFATAAFQQNPHAGRSNGLDQGFGFFFDRKVSGHRAATIYAQPMRQWLDANQDRNFFLSIHMIDPHWPYEPLGGFDHWKDESAEIDPVEVDYEAEPEGWAAEGRKFDRKKGLYDAEIAYNDYHFGKFLRRLESMGIRENTVLVFLSDHGEFLGDQQMAHHWSPSYVQGVHVPLIISYPDLLKKAARVSPPVQLLDVAPTVLDLAGINASGMMIQGHSLVPLLGGGDAAAWETRPAITEEVITTDRDGPLGWGSIFSGQWHFLNSQELGRRAAPGLQLKSPLPEWPAFFYAKSFDRSCDPKEADPIGSLKPDLLSKRGLARKTAKLQSANRKIWKNLTRGKIEDAQYDPETVEHLKQLGYLK